MKKYLVAAVLIVSFSAPALADEVYVMLEMSSKKCVTMKAMPSDMTKYKMLVSTRRLAKPKLRCTQ